VLYVDDLTKHSNQFSSLLKVGVITTKSISIPYSKVVTNFLSIDRKEDSGCPIEKLVPKLNIFDEMAELETDMESSDCIEDYKLNLMDQAWIE
jgi:hypothetical protein